jgi:hypothetical protein
MRFLVVALFASMMAHAESSELSVGFGTGVPKDGSTSTVEKSGPSRVAGGERFTITFRNYKTVSRIRLTGFSASKKGKILIHSALGFVTYDDGKKSQTNFEGLSQFAQATNGNPDNYQNNVMLEDGHYVEVTPNAPFNQIQIVVEGFTNNDAAMLLQMEATESLSLQDFVIHRTGDSEIAGAYIDETNYATLNSSDLAKLIEEGSSPSIDQLAKRSFVCTSYGRGQKTQVDYKTRAYYDNRGALQSASNLDSTMVTWVMTEAGWTLGTDVHNGCGHYQTQNILRMTAAGNLVSEVDINRYGYLVLCSNAGYDWDTQAAEFDSETYPSVISPGVDRVSSYEFCRPAAL